MLTQFLSFSSQDKIDNSFFQANWFLCLPNLPFLAYYLPNLPYYSE